MHGTFPCVFSKCNHPRFQKMLWYYHDTCPWYTMLLFSTLSFNTNPKRFAVSAKYSSLDHHLSLIAGRGFQPRFLLRSSPHSSMMTHQSCVCLCSAHRYSSMYRTAGCAGIDILQPWQNIFSRKASKDTGAKKRIKQSYGCNIDLCIMWLNVPLWLLICSE